jgi:hypothetical protein
LSVLYHWTSSLFPDKGVIYKGPETIQWHHNNYLRSPPEGYPYSELHRLFRKHGIDWFQASTKKKSKPHTEEHKKKIAEGTKKANLWNRGKKTGWWYFRDKPQRPNEGEWRISTINGMIITTNLSKWCKENNIPYHAIRDRIRRYNTFPYYKGIESVSRWNKPK